MPPARDYLDPDVPDGMLRRSTGELNSSLDAGLDPYTGKSLAGVAAARSNAKMMERLIPSFGVGARPLYGQDMNRAVSLRTGSGSVYDDAIAGGEHYVTPAVYSKGIYRGKVSDKDLATIQAPGKAAKNQELEGGAHDAEMFTREQLGRYQDMTRQVGPELTNLFNRLPAGEQAFILSKSPEERSATLKSHPLKSTSFPPAGNPAAKKATPTMFPTITPRGLGGIRPEASIDSLASEAPAAVDADYFEMAGAT